MAKNILPVAYKNGTHTPMQGGDTFDPQTLPIDNSGANLLQNDSDKGLGVFADGIVAENVPGNILTVINGKLAATPTGGTSVVSADAGNLIRPGSDQLAYASSSELLSDADVNLITSHPSDKKLILTRDRVVDAVKNGLASTDPGNLLHPGTDGGLALTVADINSTEGCNLLRPGADGKLSLCPSDLVSSDTGNALAPGADGKLFARRTDPVDIVDGTDKILVVSNDGKVLSTAFQAVYDQMTGHLTFLGKNGEQIDQVTIQSQGSVLESVQVVTDPPGMPPGTYLAMTFRKNDGTTETVYADLSAVGDVYTAGNGIDITNRVISAKVVAGGGLEATANGLQLNATAAATGLISSDTGNMIMPGTDGKLYAPLDCGELD